MRGTSTYLPPLEIMLGLQTAEQRLQTLKVCGNLDLVIEIIFGSGTLMRR